MEFQVMAILGQTKTKHFCVHCTIVFLQALCSVEKEDHVKHSEASMTVQLLQSSFKSRCKF